MKVCDYGCGKQAKFVFKNGKCCCSSNFMSCLEYKKKWSGKNNPFYGKKHSEESKKKIGDFGKGKPCSTKGTRSKDIIPELKQVRYDIANVIERKEIQ